MPINRNRCYSCDRGVAFGNNVSHANNKTRRTWKPNLQVARVQDAEGKVIKVVEWFGFKLHLLVDVKHEVVLAYEITDTKAGDGETLPVVFAQAKANLPGGRIKTLAYDRAADGQDVHELLSGEGITPLIRMRALWQTDPERMLPGHDGSSNVVYKEDGTIYCYDKVSEPPVRHPMAYIGYEPDRETLKYRCPAKHEGWDCPMSKVCNAGKSYGKTVRVPREEDPRRFPPLPRATKKFERMYKGRTAVERVNARMQLALISPADTASSSSADRHGWRRGRRHKSASLRKCCARIRTRAWSSPGTLTTAAVKQRISSCHRRVQNRWRRH